MIEKILIMHLKVWICLRGSDNYLYHHHCYLIIRALEMHHWQMAKKIYKLSRMILCIREIPIDKINIPPVEY